MPYLLDIDNTFFVIIGYSMSYVEFFGTIAYLSSVWLVAKKNMLTWPIGIISVILYFILFLQINLYADMVEQMYFLGMSLYGWWYWNKTQIKENHRGFSVSSRSLIAKCLAVTIVGGVGFGFFLMNADIILPSIFTEPASYPMIDAITTVASFVAMWLLSKKKVESWIYWIFIDVVAIWLYFIKDVKFLSLLYVILLGIAIDGWITWRKGNSERTRT
jgi:nicotinamide mononucleotide transporter